MGSIPFEGRSHLWHRKRTMPNVVEANAGHEVEDWKPSTPDSDTGVALITIRATWVSADDVQASSAVHPAGQLDFRPNGDGRAGDGVIGDGSPSVGPCTGEQQRVPRELSRCLHPARAAGPARIRP